MKPWPNCPNATRPNKSGCKALHGSCSIQAKDCRFFIDKLPLNFNFVPAIASAFPKAQFIYINRTAEATCWSMYKQLFMGEYAFSYDQQELGPVLLCPSSLPSPIFRKARRSMAGG
ncbi:MAG: hypothetical protein CM15mP74_12250 [Halieaceae bacterium]|nr:MAG: hypothetical protein CM15mP74_12250 [Halieaceae bacterium]